MQNPRVVPDFFAITMSNFYWQLLCTHTLANICVLPIALKFLKAFTDKSKIEAVEQKKRGVKTKWEFAAHPKKPFDSSEILKFQRKNKKINYKTAWNERWRQSEIVKWFS